MTEKLKSDFRIPMKKLILVLIVTLLIPLALALAPNSPVLNYPGQGATGIELNPFLNLTVTDPEGDLMNVTFYQANKENDTGLSSSCINGVNCNYAVDENWDNNYATCNTTDGAPCYFYENITYSSNFTNLSWELKYAWLPSLGGANIYIKTYCLNASNSWIKFFEHLCPTCSAFSNQQNFINNSPINSSCYQNPLQIKTELYGGSLASQFVGYIEGKLIYDQILNISSNLANNSLATYQWSNLLEGTQYFWYANITDNNSESTKSSVYNFTTGCTPSAENVSITPLPASTIQNLTCNYDWLSPCGETQSSVSYQWYINGVKNVTTQNLSSAYTNDNDSIVCSVQVNSTNFGSNWTNSSTLVIGDNIPPSIENTTISSTQYSVTDYVDIRADCADSSSLIDWVKVEVNNINYTATLLNGNTYQVKRLFALGDYNNLIFYCQDSSGNLAKKETTLSFRVVQDISGGSSSQPAKVIIANWTLDKKAIYKYLLFTPFTKEEQSFITRIKSNMPLSHCQAGNMTCQVDKSDEYEAIFNLTIINTNFLTKNFQGELKVFNKAGQLRRIPYEYQIINLAYAVLPFKLDIPYLFTTYGMTLMAIIVILFLIGIVFWQMG